MRPKRACIPSKERERYVDEASARGANAVTLGCKNRYIDEFLRFCKSSRGRHDVAELDAKAVKEFARYIYRTSFKRDTANSKLREILLWLKWVANKKKIPNLGEGLSPSSLLNELHSTEPRREMDPEREKLRKQRLIPRDSGPYDDD